MDYSEDQKSAVLNDEQQSHQDYQQEIEQFPFVDVFTKFGLQPGQDWKQNRKHGDVYEIYAQEIGRKAFLIEGEVSAQNYIQVPSPTAPHSGHPKKEARQIGLGLTGRYIYIQMKAHRSSTPFSFHFDLALAHKSTSVRISCSNLYTSIKECNGFSLQVPTHVVFNQWSVIVLDLYELLKLFRDSSNLFGDIEGCYQIKQVMLCGCATYRGVYSASMLYDFVTQPRDMRFKGNFSIEQWPQRFAWIELPSQLQANYNAQDLKQERINRVNAALHSQNNNGQLSHEQQKQMVEEIERIQLAKYKRINEFEEQQRISKVSSKGSRSNQENFMQNRSRDFDENEETLGFANANNTGFNTGPVYDNNPAMMPHKTGQFIGATNNRSEKLNLDPILELKHVIGYTTNKDKGLNVKWSRWPGENVVLFSSGATLIAMDIESSEQKRFFFGHSAPICCFDVSQSGKHIASAQDEKKSLIRIWDYQNARCLAILPMEPNDVSKIKCISFSPNGRYLCAVGTLEKRWWKGEDKIRVMRNKEWVEIERQPQIIDIINIWDISRISQGEDPYLIAVQRSEFDINCIKFSPIDNTKLVSCGRENIRVWRVILDHAKGERGTVKGTAVLLQLNSKTLSRDTEFTSLDFLHAPRTSHHEAFVDHFYVASKSGGVYRVNYELNVLEEHYQIEDCSIKSIAMQWNGPQSYCVTGGDNNILRVWQTDFLTNKIYGDVFGPINNIDISSDGLRIVCGNEQGCISLLDVSNENMTCLMRSHTGQILGMDLSLFKRCLITVASDSTIRLWKLCDDFEQCIEFSSPIDQPLCVAAHPTQPIFSCGFKSGTLRVFDISTMKLADEFQDFEGVAITKVKYSPNADILVVVAENGSVAIHNAQRKHQPTKVMTLSFQPPHVHLAFSSPIYLTVRQNPISAGQRIHEDKSDVHEMFERSSPGDDEDASGQMSESKQSQIDIPDEPLNDCYGNEVSGFEDQQIQEAYFSVMGEYGNNVCVYDSTSILLKHQIQIGHVCKAFEFTKLNASELVVATEDLRIRVYYLKEFGGQLSREILTCHRYGINSLDISLNGGYMLTGGADHLLKIWDYQEANTQRPYYFQAFIGHTYPITQAMFTPWDNTQIVSIAENDGIYIWQFEGDVETDFNCEDDIVREVFPIEELHMPTQLERMRTSVREKKTPKLQPLCFNNPKYEQIISGPTDIEKDQNEKYECTEQNCSQCIYNKRRREQKLSYNHFVSIQDQRQIKTKPSLQFPKHENLPKIGVKLINGYEGFSGAHNNLYWNLMQGKIVYSLNNKIIEEDTKQRSQKVFTYPSRISCMDYFPKDGQTQGVSDKAAKFNTVVYAEGEPDQDGFSNIYLMHVEVSGIKDNQSQPIHTPIIFPKFHQKGVQALKFLDEDTLVSVGTAEQNILVVWDVSQCRKKCETAPQVLASVHIDENEDERTSTNEIIVNMNTEHQQKYEQKNQFDKPTKYHYFYTVGSNNSLICWLFLKADCSISCAKVSKPDYIQATNYVTAEYFYKETDLNKETNLCSPQKLVGGLLIGCSDGNLLYYDHEFGYIFDKPFYQQIMKDEIGHIRIKYTQYSIKKPLKAQEENSVVVFGKCGTIVTYKFKIDEKNWSYPIPTCIDDLSPKDGTTYGIKTNEAITAVQMDDKNIEGIFGTSKGNIYYVNLEQSNEGDQQTQEPIKLVTRAAPGLDLIKHVQHDVNIKELFFSGSGECCSDSNAVRMFVSQSLDQVIQFPNVSQNNTRFNEPENITSISRQQNMISQEESRQTSKLAFIAGFQEKGGKAGSGNKQVKLFGSSDGTLRFMTFDKLDLCGVFNLNQTVELGGLEPGEEVTAGAFTKSGHNFVVGTNRGNLFFGCRPQTDDKSGYGSSHKDKRSSQKSAPTFTKIGMIKGHLSEEETNFEVSSIQLADFSSSSPQGWLIVAFSNGKVRAWKAGIVEDPNDFSKKSNQKPEPYWFNVPNIRFDIKDRFNMFNPNASKDDSIPNWNGFSQDQTEMQLIANQPYLACEIQLYSKGKQGSAEDAYFCYHSNLQQIFARNFKKGITEKIINIDFAPTAMHIVSKSAFISHSDSGKSSSKEVFFVCYGTDHGMCYIHEFSFNEKEAEKMKPENPILKTEQGIAYGAITSVSVSDDGKAVLTGTESGEIIYFDLLEALNALDKDKKDK